MAGQDVLVTPPIRQSVEDANSAQANGIAQPMTEKSWYLYWDRLGKMANRQNWMVNVGTHTDRPPAANMPNGAIYVEFDRGVIYQNWSGAWQYLAGTMYGTFAPDQRPTDLGSHDAGFDYRTTDQPPREFIWSGTAWVEVTAVTVGTHANRPAAAGEAEGNLYVEYDRGGVIYQNWVGGWQYLAGTMWGTLVPDQRPTDLATRDAGFDYRTTDAPPREFVWSGTAWIEIGAEYWVNGTLIGTRPGLNLIAGSNVTISGSDNAGADRVDVTVSSSGGGGTGGAVTSVFTRTGAVVAQAGDYSAYQVTNAVDQTSSYANPAWITSLAWSKITGAPATGVSSVFGRAGAVVAATGDYTAAQITNAVDSTATYANPAWITSLAYAKITGAPWTIVAPGIAYTGGNVGIGTATPGVALDVHGAIKSTLDANGLVSGPGIAQLQIVGSTNTNKSLWLGFDTSNNVGVIQAGITGTGWNNLILQPSGANVAIGAATASALLSLGTSVAPIKAAVYDGGGAAVYGIGINGAGLLTFGASINPSSGVPQMVLSSSGGLGLGLGAGVAPAYTLQLVNDSAAKPSTNVWTIASDIRVKQNVRPLEGGLDVINRLEPIVSEYNGKAGTPRDGRVVSLDAAKLREILPHAVSSMRGRLDPADAEETDILGVNTHEILYHLVLAVQQLSKK